VPRTGKIIKHRLHIFERGENFVQNSLYTLCILGKSIVRNQTSKLKYRKTDFSGDPAPLQAVIVMNIL